MPFAIFPSGRWARCRARGRLEWPFQSTKSPSAARLNRYRWRLYCTVSLSRIKKSNSSTRQPPRGRHPLGAFLTNDDSQAGAHNVNWSRYRSSPRASAQDASNSGQKCVLVIVSHQHHRSHTQGLVDAAQHYHRQTATGRARCKLWIIEHEASNLYINVVLLLSRSIFCWAAGSPAHLLMLLAVMLNGGMHQHAGQ